MKVITEESLRYVLNNHFGDDVMNQSIASHLINECQELDQLTVTKLRPMSEAPDQEDDEFLVKIKGDDRLCFVVIFEGNIIRCCDWIDPNKLEGWIPMPRYEPEQS